MASEPCDFMAFVAMNPQLATESHAAVTAERDALKDRLGECESALSTVEEAATRAMAERDEAIRERDAAREALRLSEEIAGDEGTDLFADLAAARRDITAALDAIEAWDRQRFPGRKLSRNDVELLRTAKAIRARTA